VNAAGQFSVMGSAALLGQCRLLVGLDTGTTHMAAALDVPSVVLFADRTRPGQWEPLGDRHILIRKAVACGGCLKRDCPVPDHPCMTGISVDEVWAAMEKALGVPLSVTP
jgi:ADP-heptose:LPS heptosyltransferase